LRNTIYAIRKTRWRFEVFQGSMTAIVTPFRNGRVDEKGFRRLIEFQIKGGTDGIVPCGTTGESATLTYEEHERVVEIAIDAVNGRVPVIAGTGSNSTDETISFTRHAERAGADGALLISPYYNKPTQEGLYQHYRAVAKAVSIPLILYNVPGRTALNMLPETVARLSEFRNIIGIKEASGSLAQVSDVLEMSRKGFIVLSGDDFITLPMLAIGAKGAISVTSNIIPKEMSRMCTAQLGGDTKKALRLHYKMQPLNRAMFLETNPMPVKTALAMMGLVREEFRLPLVKMRGDKRRLLRGVLQSYDLLQGHKARR
jgi:4-hydroxy-tetrahydrodipicolinate synthase